MYEFEEGTTIQPATSVVEGRERDFTRTGENQGDDRYVRCLGCDDGLMVVCVCVWVYVYVKNY